MIYNFNHRGEDFHIDLYDHADLLRLWFTDYHHNFYEIELLDYMSTLGPQTTILDIGANIGNHALYFQRFLSYSQIICFEPQHDNFNKLCNNIDFTKSIVAHKFALGNFNGRIGLEDNFMNRGNVSIKSGTDVPIYRLDDLGIVNISLMKIDVEAYELEVLKGASKIISRDHPRMFIEMWKEKLNENSQFLEILGYKQGRIFDVDGIKVYEFYHAK